ncbi:serine/threonine protein kinase [Streptomyces sp. MUM 203J]|uniref:serine/threonine-protein kinase n=1 Tax=Streptomyces sp. MUM 203J TaxID=2791990 RepID=UPI001F03C3CA|nr:serine/threonine-protein kinase [Streptomyces sp. MUM 203J]MCH0542989.1 serine/threonine protein kinase [Streptomyces sp. MUM 203J]
MADTRLIHGRYRLLEVIGRGGMGEVWRATDEALGRRVAVKCLKPLGPQHDPDFVRVLRERFRREARVAASLQHRGVTVVHDFGESDDTLFLVMELLEGRDLSRLLADNQHHPLPLPEIVDIAEQVADALAYTHRQGIVHRDLKPANIVRLADGGVKICDFGIARPGADISAGSRLTSGGIALGTPHYMSPEQISGGRIDHRSDLYSLGCVLYEIATGAPPFDQEDALAVLVGHRDTPPQPLRARRAELPPLFEQIVLDLLAKTPDARPADAGDLRRRITGARPVVLPAPHPAGPPPGVPAPEPAGLHTLPYDSTPAAPAVARPGPSAPAGIPYPAPVPPPLPAWTRSMSGGRRALGAVALHPAPPADPTAGLTGRWTRAVGAPTPTPGGGTPAASRRTTPPPGLLSDLAGRHSAGLGLGRLGRWGEAAEIHRAVATERERLLGPDHPDTLASRYEVGFTLSRTGHTTDALREFTHVADGRARALGPDHPDTLTARQETAYVLGRLGRHAEAQHVYTGVLAARERVLGPDHPDTLRCRHNLAFTLGRLGRLEESYRMAYDVAAARTRLLGPDHPDTLVTRYEVAHTLGLMGRWTDALRHYREVAFSRARVLGPDHPDTLAAHYEAGISLGRLGQGQEALGLFGDLVAARTRAGGPDDPETLRARHGLGVNLGRLGRWEEALAEARDVAAVRERVLGADHPDTLVSCREVAVCLGWLGRWAEALSGYERVARARERLLGPDHPDTLAGHQDEAQCLERLGRREEAVALYQRVAAVRSRSATPG